MKWLFMLVLLAVNTARGGEAVDLCFNYECRSQMTIEFDQRDLRRAARLFLDAADAPAEREAIRQAVALLAGVAANRSPIGNDKGGNVADDGVNGRMDCIDHSRTTTEYLRLLERRHWLRFHRVLTPVVRAPLLVNIHWAARIEEQQSGAQFVVDTWFKPNGEPAAIFDLEAWRRGAVPKEASASAAAAEYSPSLSAALPDG